MLTGQRLFPIWLTMTMFSFVAVPISEAQNPVIRVGIAIDGPWERNDEIRSKFEAEITQLLQSEYTIQFPPEKRLQADWTAAGVKAGIDQLLADPGVDYVLTLGVLSSNDVAQRGPLPKPVIAPFILLPRIQDIPYQSQVTIATDREKRIHFSGVTNLSYVAVGTDIPKELSRFREIVPFTRLTILSMQALSEQVPAVRENLIQELGPMGLEVSFVRVGDSLDQALTEILPDTQAVYVAPLLQLHPGDFDRLVRALITRKLPSFSLWGRSEVEKGLLASLALDVKIDRIARRTALNLQRILGGEQASEIPVDFAQDERLTINMATARAIDVYPSFAVLTEAELLKQPRTHVSRRLTLSKVVLEASQANLDLAEANRRIAAGTELVREARAGLFPQVGVSALGTFIDKDRAEASLGSQGQRQIAGSFSASQLIYSDRVRAGYQIEQLLQISRQEQRRQLLLDVIQEAAQGYLNVLRTKKVERIQRENLELTRRNLELAQSRVALGATGREEVLRWKSQIAINRKDVIAANARRNQAEIVVNRLLNRPIEENFLTDEAGLDDPELVTSFKQIRPFVDNQVSFSIFRRFMVKEAFETSPELKQLGSAIRAQQRALLTSKRVFYVPTLAVQADATGFKNGGAGLQLPPQVPFTLISPNNLNWAVGINASLSLFEGGALRAQRSRAEAELEELKLRRDASRQRIEERVRSILHQAGASFTGIRLSEMAADAAKANLDLVQDAYSEGTLEILRLLDAQNQALIARLTAANAVFDYLLDLMAVQRAIGKFDYFRSAQDRQDFIQRMETFFRKEGFDP